jgi:two-component system chemotaxis response regulator CheY
MQSNARNADAVIRVAKVLVVDDEFCTRKAIRTQLLSVGVTNVHDAPDGLGGLAAIRALDPDVVILDWQMAGMNGPDFVRQVRSPGKFPFPNVPIIMLTGHGERSRVIEAMRLGVHEFLLKPVSDKALRERLASVLLNPRPMVRGGDYYGPERRKNALRRTGSVSLEEYIDPAMPDSPSRNSAGNSGSTSRPLV